MEQRVLVCGGRDYTDRDHVFMVLDALLKAALSDTRLPVLKLMHGGAKGADALAAEWAKQRSVECDTYPADWKLEGPSAGPKRNQKMIDAGKPYMVIAFPGGRGTADMVEKAEKAGVPVVRIRHEGEVAK